MKDTVARILAETLGIATAGPQTAMDTTPEWDSVMHLNVCMTLESEFGVNLAPEEYAEMTSFDAICAVLARHGK